MEHLPPIVLECPECGEKYLVSRYSNLPSEKAILFSDGFFIDDLNWRTPLIIGCVTCELGFFPQNGKIVAEPDWDEFYTVWSEIKKAQPPTPGALALELRARKKMTLFEEVALRTEFWYAGNHTEPGRLMLTKNEKFRKFWIESITTLEQIIPTDSLNSQLIKAEINRNLGHFERSLSLLDGLENNTAAQIREKALQKDIAVFQLVK